MDHVGRLLLTVLLISASSCIVQAKLTRYSIQFQEQTGLSDTPIFQALSPDPVRLKGTGRAKHNNVTHPVDGSVVGSVGGIIYFHATDSIEDVVTITFSSNLAGIWKDSSLNVRGFWRMNAQGNVSFDEQELSIVGGQGGLRGASGSVYYSRIHSLPGNVWLVTCDVFIDKLKYRMPKTYVDLSTQFKSHP